MDALWALFSYWQFYAQIVGVLFAWWVLSCLIARMLFGSGVRPIRAATLGAVISMIVCVVLIPAALILVGSFWLAVALGLVLLLMPGVLLLILVRSDVIRDF